MPRKTDPETLYRQPHRAPDYNDAPLHDVTGNGVYPKDFYKTYWQYRSGEPLDRDAEYIVLSRRGRPDRTTYVYRAVPKGVRTINPGDWVTTVKQYARDHGKHSSDSSKDMPVIEARAKTSDLFTDGNSLLEWGYNGAEPLKATVVFRPRARTK